jgi:predicted ferric reductase
VILMAACGHTTLHLLNLAFAYDNSVALFGRSAWITGGVILLWMFIIFTGTGRNVKSGQFEIFWYSHHCFILFFAFILFHGKGGVNPHYWMYAIPCLSIYVLERGLRIYRSSLPVAVLSISLMDDVLSLEFAKEGSVFEFEQYKEGQYLFLLAPSCSRIQWHPFTISSAPQEHSVTVHIRVMGEGSWTRGLMQYMATMGPKGKSLIQLDRQGPSGKLPGKILGPDGRALIQIDGPHRSDEQTDRQRCSPARDPCNCSFRSCCSQRMYVCNVCSSAPTQHIGEYGTVMVIGAGIGATPVASCLKSVVFHKWRVNVGECFPARAHFMWVCAWRDIDAFRWLIRIIKEAQDEV